MITGANGPDNFLWKLRIKINTPDGGLNFLCHLPDMSLVLAKAAALKICIAYKALVPSTCEIKRATISKSNTNKDSKLLKNVIGDGLYGGIAADPPVVPTVYNRYTDCIKVRFEDTDGGGVTMKIAPVPDTIILGGGIPLPIDSVEDMTVADPAAPVQPVLYSTAFKNLMILIGKNCCRVEAKTNIPGGSYKYAKFDTAHVLGVGGKKGGLVSVK